jgi:hypothetical protein
MNCKEAKYQILMLNELDQSGLINDQLLKHIKICPDCAEEYNKMLKMIGVLKEMSRNEPQLIFPEILTQKVITNILNADRKKPKLINLLDSIIEIFFSFPFKISYTCLSVFLIILFLYQETENAYSLRSLENKMNLYGNQTIPEINSNPEFTVKIDKTSPIKNTQFLFTGKFMNLKFQTYNKAFKIKRIELSYRSLYKRLIQLKKINN